MAIIRHRSLNRRSIAGRRSVNRLSVWDSSDSPEGVATVGCGEGRLLEFLARRCTAITRLAGCDLSPRLCEMAARRVPTAEIRRESAVGLEAYDEGEFDFLFMVSTLEHLLDRESAVRSAYRVLKPGGVFVVATTNRNWALYERWRRHHVQVEPVDSHWFEPDELLDLLTSAGFQIERVRGVWARVRAISLRPAPAPPARRSARSAPP